MKKSRINADKVLAYKEKLHSLLSSASEENFVGSKWAKTVKASVDFIPACKRLGYIAIHYKNRKHPIYTAKLAPASVEPVHGRNVYEEVSKIAEERGKKKVQEIVTPTPLPEHKGFIKQFHDTELVEELKRRGYSGKLTRSETLEI